MATQNDQDWAKAEAIATRLLQKIKGSEKNAGTSPDFEGFTREIIGNWPLAVEGEQLHEIAVRHGVITEETDDEGETWYRVIAPRI